jgi:hypothetical protein
MTRLEPEKVYQAAETLIRRYVIGDVSPDGKSPGT